MSTETVYDSDNTVDFEHEKERNFMNQFEVII